MHNIRALRALIGVRPRGRAEVLIGKEEYEFQVVLRARHVINASWPQSESACELFCIQPLVTGGGAGTAVHRCILLFVWPRTKDFVAMCVENCKLHLPPRGVEHCEHRVVALIMTRLGHFKVALCARRVIKHVSVDPHRKVVELCARTMPLRRRVLQVEHQLIYCTLRRPPCPRRT